MDQQRMSIQTNDFFIIIGQLYTENWALKQMIESSNPQNGKVEAKHEASDVSLSPR